MINGLTRSQIFIANRSKSQHYNRLKAISTSKPNLFIPCKQLISHEKQLKKYHKYANSFSKSQQKRELKAENRKLVMSMIKIATRDNSKFDQIAKKKKYRKHNSNKKIVCSQQINRQKRQKQIKSSNIKLAQSIIRQKTAYSVQRNEKQYQQSRQFFNRINKFPIFSRINNNNSSKLLNSNNNRHKKSLIMEAVDLGESIVFEKQWKIKLTQSRVQNPQFIQTKQSKFSDLRLITEAQTPQRSNKIIKTQA